MGPRVPKLELDLEIRGTPVFQPARSGVEKPEGGYALTIAIFPVPLIFVAGLTAFQLLPVRIAVRSLCPSPSLEFRPPSGSRLLPALFRPLAAAHCGAP